MEEKIFGKDVFSLEWKSEGVMDDDSGDDEEDKGEEDWLRQGSLLTVVAWVSCCWLVVSTSAIDCLERLVSEMTYYVSSGTLNPTHSLTRKNNAYSAMSAGKAEI